MMLLKIAVLAALVSVIHGDFYSSRYDNFDITPLIENDRILLNYTRCFLDKGPCTPEAKDFKKVIPEALKTTCGKCTPKQKHLIKTVIKTLIKRHPEMWAELVKKYDKENVYEEVFAEFLKDE